MRASETEGTRDVFLSHSSANKPLVRKIAADVQAHERADGARLTVWLDEAEIRPGTVRHRGSRAVLQPEL